METNMTMAVIGAGLMGRGIAQIFSAGGYRALLYDTDGRALESAMAWIRENMEEYVSREKLTGEEARQILRRITIMDSITDAVHPASIIVEAVPEVMETKQKVLNEISAVALPSALITTNTSTMSITELAAAVRDPGQFLGVHFFHPVTRLKLVEVIYGRQTRSEAADSMFRIIECIGKKPVRVLKDAPGFIVNRVNAPTQALINAVIEEGLIPPHEIDCEMRKLGLPMGPFEIADFVGLDVFVNTLQYYTDHLSRDYQPGPRLLDMIDKGLLGAKTGMGIYRWENGKADIPMDRQSSEINAISFIAIQVNEAVKIVREGIARSRQDVDMAVRYGMNAFAGPFALAAGIDPSRLREELEKLRNRYALSIFSPEPEIVDGSFLNI